MPYLCGMKQLFIILSLLLFPAVLSAQRLISGRVTDGHKPLENVNVYIKGTMDGALTDSLGIFRFTAQQGDTLVASCIGFDQAILILGKSCDHLSLRIHPHTATINEVVVTGSGFSFGETNGVKRMGALDIVTDGASGGDIVAALQSLPGTQKVGENGKLYVRGGSSDECQTYINGMHVLQPYTTTAQNSPSRGRFSPFLFKGIDFSLGGYDAEYDQALSSVLPMETTDQSATDKLGVSASLIDWNFGGTKAMKAGSLSMNATYLDLGLYHRLFPDRWDWQRPYRQLSGELQWKMQPSSSVVSKTYLGYDHTSLALNTDNRLFDLHENNIYWNSVLKGTAKGRLSWFAGMAVSGYGQHINSLWMSGDRMIHRSGEIHLKAKAMKVLSSALKVTMGAENMIRHVEIHYALPNETAHLGTVYPGLRYEKSYQLPAAFAEAQYRLIRNVYAEASLRTDYSSMTYHWLFLPRVVLNYCPNSSLRLSLSGGRYSQEAIDTIQAQGTAAMASAVAEHYIFSLHEQLKNTTIQVEAYYKHYHHLPLWQGSGYSSDGYGWSRGFDVFFDDHSLSPNLSTTISYSYNDSRRLWLDNAETCRPDFASRHNLRLSIRYQWRKLLFGITESYASPRLVRGRNTPYYNSLDAAITWLPSKRVIVYSALSNLLNRRNIYGYQQNGQPITGSSNHFFYLGIFISLKSNKAYDISNF